MRGYHGCRPCDPTSPTCAIMRFPATRSNPLIHPEPRRGASRNEHHHRLRKARTSALYHRLSSLVHALFTLLRRLPCICAAAGLVVACHYRDDHNPLRSHRYTTAHYSTLQLPTCHYSCATSQESCTGSSKTLSTSSPAVVNVDNGAGGC